MMLARCRAAARFAILLAALLPAAARGGDPPAAVGATEVEGRKAKALLKRSNGSIRVYAFRGGAATPIPFQVDERDHRDHWADDEGPSPVRDESPGIFDDNDVIVFMNHDLGARGAAAKLPPGAATWLEVRVGPEKQPIGYAYVGAFDSPPPLPRNLPDHCRYDPRSDEVFADRYTVRFAGPLPSYLGLVPHPGAPAPNVLNGVRARGEVWILGGLFHIVRSEKDIQYSLQGYRDGPVRVIRSAKYWLTLPLGFKARGKVELLFYENFVEGRARVNIKIPPRLVPAEGEMTAHFDFHDFGGARVLDPSGALSPPLDDQTLDARRELGERPMRWAALRLPDGRTFLLAVRLGGSLARLDQRLYLDDSGGPEGGKPGFGFRLSGVSRLDTGEQELSVNGMVLDEPTEGGVAKAADMLLSPPAVSVAPLAR